MYDIVFVVLVYRNTDDLKDFFISNHLSNTKTIVVNSYYDDKTEGIFSKIASDNNADFISVPNNGYGAGNNRGIEHALSKYSFKYLVISNADIMIQRLDMATMEKMGDVIIAPKIINLNNRNQNPSAPFTPHKFSLLLWKFIYENDLRPLSWCMFAWSRVKKILYYLISRWHRQVFSAHGAFVVFPVSVLKKLVPIYNEKMFLFVEEEHLGMLALSKGIKTVYCPEIIIRHKENGSMNIASVNEFEKTKQSYLIYYNYWFS